MIGGKLTQKTFAPGNGGSPNAPRGSMSGASRRKSQAPAAPLRFKKMGGADCCGRACLIVVNILFGVIGFTMLTSGLVLVFGWSLIESFVEPILEGLTNLGSDSTTAATTTDATTAVDNFRTLINIGAYVLIALGGIIVVVGSCGCCGACCSVKCMLLAYCIVMLVMIVAEIVFMALWADKTLYWSIYDKLTIWLEKDYVSVSDFSMGSLIINIVQIKLECCGIWSWGQWNDAAKWEREITIDGNTYEQVIPMSCCVVTGSFPNVEPVDTNCTITPDDSNAHLNSICDDKLQDKFSEYDMMIMGGVGGLMAFQIIMFAVGACIAVKVFDKSDDKRRNRVHPSPHDKSPEVGRPTHGARGGKNPNQVGQQAEPLPSKGGPPPPYETGGANPSADSWQF